MIHGKLINIGDELLIGQVVNGNAAEIGQMLTGIGVRIDQATTIGDDRRSIRYAIEEAWSSCDLVLLTGGLGPTRDDMTKLALADFFGTELVFSEKAYAYLKKHLASRRKKPSDNLYAQCYMPDKFELLRNQAGTAPGLYHRKKGKLLIALPGVPHEMRHLMETQVLSLIRRTFPGTTVVHHRTICTAGLAESAVSEKLHDLEQAMPPTVSLAFLPSPGRIRLRVMWTGGPVTDAQSQVDWWAEAIRQRLGHYVYAITDTPLATAVGKLLMEHDATLSISESCTGGYLGHAITAISGSSAYFTGGAITYSNDMKMQILGVKKETLDRYGAVSEETAREMATGALRVFGSDYALAITGIAGPDGGSRQKPVGTVWIGAGSQKDLRVKRFHFSKNRQHNIELSAFSALNMLRNVLNGRA